MRVALVTALAALAVAEGSGALDARGAPGAPGGASHGGLTRATEGAGDGTGLVARWTGRRAERIETIPVAERRRGEPRSALSLRLPELEPGDVLRFSGEVTLTTTCVEPLPRCIGRPYRFDPRMGAQLVLGPSARAARPGVTRALTERARVACEQTRPNRNHHCPFALAGTLRVPAEGRLGCPPDDCRLNMVVDAHHRAARGGEVVVVGADRPDGSIEGGKARLSAALERAGAPVREAALTTERRRARTLPASGEPRVVLSQRLDGLRRGDVLLLGARQRASIGGLPYFMAAKAILATRPDAANPGSYARRVIARTGTATDTNGFNCTPGPSAFESPCLTRKAGLAYVRSTPRRASGRPRPLYANLVMRSFPKIAQARGGYPPARVGRGALRITRLRLAAPER